MTDYSPTHFTDFDPEWTDADELARIRSVAMAEALVDAELHQLGALEAGNQLSYHAIDHWVNAGDPLLERVRAIDATAVENGFSDVTVIHDGEGWDAFVDTVVAIDRSCIFQDEDGHAGHDRRRREQRISDHAFDAAKRIARRAWRTQERRRAIAAVGHAGDPLWSISTSNAVAQALSLLGIEPAEIVTLEDWHRRNSQELSAWYDDFDHDAYQRSWQEARRPIWRKGAQFVDARVVAGNLAAALRIKLVNGTQIQVAGTKVSITGIEATASRRILNPGMTLGEATGLSLGALSELKVSRVADGHIVDQDEMLALSRAEPDQAKEQVDKAFRSGTAFEVEGHTLLADPPAGFGRSWMRHPDDRAPLM